MPNHQWTKSELERYSEAVKLATNLVIKLSDLKEIDLLDIHFQKIIKELLNLYAMLESYGDADDSRLENQNDIQQL